MIIPVSLGKDSYNIILERGALKRAAEILNLRRKVLIVTDKGVPSEYVRQAERACGSAVIADIVEGEVSKSLQSVEALCRTMLAEGFTRKDCVVALGGGVTGDLAGFAASCYMRGIDFYNIPTTLLSQVDSSVGGKTAVDLDGIKNIVGAFYQPKAVLIDPEVLNTLSDKQMACGAAEIIKMAACFDRELFERIEKSGIRNCLDESIAGALRIKAQVVEKDEREAGLRRALNFGHTIGHGIESATGMLHGQCVALGMLPMTAANIRERLIAVLKSEGLDTELRADKERVIEASMHDKKAEGDKVIAVRLEEIGRFSFAEMDRLELLSAYEEAFH